MLLRHFQFREQPFGATPDPRFLYHSRTHREALASLYCAFHDNRGFSMLIAPPGMGKTTLLFHFLESIHESARTVFLFDTQCEPRDLIRYILRDLGITPAGNAVEMHHQLNEALLVEARAGRKFVVVIDEAQNLSDEALETIRLLTNFETPRRKLMQIVLVGQPQLCGHLLRDSLVQLRQRISTVCRLETFSASETAEYIDHRLKVAGHGGRPLFTSRAMQLITEAAHGIPREINCLCFNALTLCFGMKAKQVTHHMVAEVINDLRLDSAWQSSVPESDATPLVKRQTIADALTLPGFGWLRRLGIGATAAVALTSFGILSFTSSKAGQKLRPNVDRSETATVVTPKVSPTETTPPPLDKTMEINVEPSQTLRTIALRYLGECDEKSLQEIRVLNPGLTDPNLIHPGQKIRIPEQPRAGAENRLQAAKTEGVE